MLHLLTRVFCGLALVFQLGEPVLAAHSATAQATRLALAGVQVEIELPFAAAEFIQPAADDAQQTATAATWDPFFEVSLEAAPVAVTDTASLKRSLQLMRADQAATGLAAHAITFFGQTVSGASNQVVLPLRAASQEVVVVHEWTAQAYERAWTFRVSYTPGQGFDESLLDQIVIRGAGIIEAMEPALARQSAAAEQAPVQAAAIPDDLAAPAWWSSDCDATYYKSKSGLDAYPLGGIYRGVKACGPRPWADGAPDVLVRFYTGAWGEYEWECVELSMRFMYLAYGIAPYSGNGKDVVANYSGTVLRKISNGTIGTAPQPGDVLSYGPTTTYGHTSVVTATNVDASGNGSITIMEQNSSVTGVKTLTVESWVVKASSTVSGWLHKPLQTVDQPYRMYIPGVMR